MGGLQLRYPELWRDKYSTLLNSVDDRSEQGAVNSAINDISHSDPIMTTPEEMCIYAGELSNGKSCGIDCIPAEFFKNAPARVFEFMSRFVNGVMCHSYVPRLLTDILLKPVVKSSLKDPTDSGNYRLIAVATSASKLIEKVIYSRIERYLRTSSNQFGFKKG